MAPDTFKSGVDGLPNPSDYTPTAAGITTAAGDTGAGDRSGVSNALFVITDGSPNRPPSGGNLNDASTWLTGANAAIDAANTARSQGWVVKAIYVGEPDPSLPFSTSDRAVWVDADMKAIGGGSVTELSNFSSLVNGLLISVGCPTPPPAEPPTTATTAPATTAPATTAPAPTGPAPTAPATTAPAPSQSLEGASVSPSQGVEGVTSAPTVTPASTSIGGTTGGSSGSSLFPLLVALVFGAFGLMAAAVQRRSARR